jgi:glycosyltransferase involved in cell wall biosynthesis
MLAKMISIIIPVFNSQATLLACLNAVYASEYENYEVILVDNCSRDSTLEIAGRFTCRIIRLEKNYGAAYARNRGAQAAQGEILFSTDPDIKIFPDTLKRVEVALNDQSVDAVVGLLGGNPAQCNFFSQYENLYMHYVYLNHSREIGIFYTSCAAIRKESFSKLKFDEHYKRTSIEDMEFGQRMAGAGLRLVLNKELEVEHMHYFNLWGLVKKNFFKASGAAKIILRNRGKIKAGLVAPKWAFLSGIPLSFLTALLISVFLLNRNPRMFYLSALVMGGTFLINYRFLDYLKEKKGAFFFFKSCLMLFINFLIYACGIIWGVFSFALGRKY